MSILPIIPILISKSDLKVFIFNIKHSLAWTRADFKWLFLTGFAAISKKISLPEQGKFNAAEKLHFITLITAYPLYIATGILIWSTNSALLPWFFHFTTALIATPFMFSHIFMATLNPNTRIAMSGMTSGLVDRHYVIHHHASWYKEKFKDNGNSEAIYEEEEEAKVGIQQEVKSGSYLYPCVTH